MTLSTPIVSVGGASAPVTFSGLAPGFVGLYQVNIQVPAACLPAMRFPSRFRLAGVAANTVTIAVQ